MATKRLTSRQRKAQAYKVNENLKREAERFMQERQMSFDDAFRAVLEDKELSAKCHNVGSPESFPADWKEPQQ